MAYVASVPYQQPVQGGWVTGQYPQVPLAPNNFQPQSTWGGLDFYRARAPTDYDPAFFNNAWDRVRTLDSAVPGGLGVGVNEAKHWHRRAYGGMSELSVMNPAEIGHAAAYEAYRSWRHNASYDLFGSDNERQREALIGLAVAEASRLLSFAGRAMDQYTRTVASDSAAHTASFIFFQRLRDADQYHQHRRGRSRGRYDEYDDFEDDRYGYGDDPYAPRGRSRSRHRGLSRPRSYSTGPYDGTPYPPGPGMLPGVPSYTGSASGMMSGAPPMSPGGYSSGYSSSGFYPPPNPYGPGPQGSYNAYGQPMSAYPGQGGMYPNPGMPMAVPMGHAPSGSSNYSYGSQPYMGSAGSTGSMSMGVPGQTIVIHKSRRHKHRSRSRAGSD